MCPVCGNKKREKTNVKDLVICTECREDYYIDDDCDLVQFNCLEREFR